jgi:hypothetical protein
MYYKYSIEYYEDDDQDLYCVSGIVYANCYADALDKIDNAYDVSTLEKITIEKEDNSEVYEMDCHKVEKEGN